MYIEDFKTLVSQKVLVLDGAMGTMIQRLSLKEDDFRGDRFSNHPIPLAGCNDILCISRPDDILDIHRAYICAGADIISTNSFNANAISLKDYGLNDNSDFIIELNRKAASIAREAANQSNRRILVAGSVGPTNRTASISPDVSDPAARSVDYDELFEAYSYQTEGLILGGADIILFETVFDILNLKAGLDAASHVMDRMEKILPIMVSVTLSDKAGRTLSGQTLNAFITTIKDYKYVVSIGLNCSFGATQMLPHLRDLSSNSPHFVSAHPNAGLPDEMGCYVETPELFVKHITPFLKESLVNIIGGCCGTTPEHIRLLAEEVSVLNPIPHVSPILPPALRIAGLEEVSLEAGSLFLNVGERCNVAGSRKFLRLIKEGNLEEAAAIAHKQVMDGAMAIDINMDDAMLDSKSEMVRFLRFIAADPEIARVPVMVDSSDWSVIEDALKNLQGKSIVNSISLKEGEESFLYKALRIKELGAAIIVMAFDEEGQADTFERRISISRRAYNLLVNECGYSPEDIIFDVNIMAVATGIETHNSYAIDFIRAVAWIKENLPGARTSGGVSNLSFAFRGKNALREAMHAVFLYHAISHGLDMAIMNPASSVTYESIEPGLRTLIEDVILNRRPEAADELAEYALSNSSVGIGNIESGATTNNTHDFSIPVEDRLRQAIISGNRQFLEDDLKEASSSMRAIDIIEGPLMNGMNRVGNLFGEGKMFLPQVVKTARVMKSAVDYLSPLLKQESAESSNISAGKVVIATVKGDVHDIGKNIVAIVMTCNNFEVIDLGVMVPPEDIVATVKREKPDIICLSGLITPSLNEMVNVARALENEGIDTPIMIGGATTSLIHTALKIAPEYSGIVVHIPDAARNPVLAAKLVNPEEKEKLASKLKEEYHNLREEYNNSHRNNISIEEARKRGPNLYEDEYKAPIPKIPMQTPICINLSLDDIIPLINWKMLFKAWKVSPSSSEAKSLLKDAMQLLNRIESENIFDGKVAVAFYEASSRGDVVEIQLDHNNIIKLQMVRQTAKDSRFLSLADYIKPSPGVEPIGVFATTAGNGLASEAKRLESAGDDYSALLVQSLSDRLAEASSEWLHKEVRRTYWGYAEDEDLSSQELLRGGYRGIRPAFGYPMLPDQLQNLHLGKLLPLQELGITLTENGGMSPASSVSGLYISHPKAKYFII